MASRNSHSPRRLDSGVPPDHPVRLTSINFMGLTLGALLCKGRDATAVAYTEFEQSGGQSAWVGNRPRRSRYLRNAARPFVPRLAIQLQPLCRRRVGPGRLSESGPGLAWRSL